VGGALCHDEPGGIASAVGVCILQSGYLNFYNGLIGLLLVLILGLALFYE
jgi:hypothetical protein